MKIGVISDTHDNLVKIKRAVEILNANSVDFVVHCGDYVAPFALSPLARLNCDWCGVFGNNDGEREGLSKKSQGRIKEPPYFLNLASRQIVIMHELKDARAQIVLFGHTHEPVIDKGRNILINPGETGGWLSGESTLAILNLRTLESVLLRF